MKAYQTKVEELLTGTKRYFVPPYQRPYRWDPENAEQLVQDVCRSYQADEEEYFIGSMICIKDGDRFEIVDGQQRLITLTIILQQLKKLISIQAIAIELKNRILRVDPFSEDKSPAVLRVRKSEHDFYRERILHGNEDVKPKNDIERVFLNNQQKIKECLLALNQEERINFARHLLKKVFIVFVEVDDRVSSFRLFNVLNSRGMPLNDADLIKNMLLEKVSEHRELSEEVERKWQRIEDTVGERYLDNFLSLQIHSEKKDRDRVKKKNFAYYEERLQSEFDSDAVAMLNTLIKSVDNYENMMQGNLGAKEVISLLKNFNRYEWIPAFMAFLNNGHGGEKFPAFAKLFEKVYMQCLLRKLRPSQREMPRYSAVEAINNGKSFDEIMTCLKDCSDDALFIDSLDVPDFYDGSRPQIINLVKSVLVCVDRKRHDDNVQVDYTGRISVEHILPQKHSDPYWKNRFTAEECEEWVHKLGNLTLVSSWKNSAAKNYCFDKKKEAYEKSNLKCSFDITKELCDLPEWDMKTLMGRHEKLKEEIKKLWLVGLFLIY